MATHKSTHICKPHKPMHKAKLAKEYAFQPTKKNYFPTLLFLIFFCHALTATATRQDNFLHDSSSTTLTKDRRAADNMGLASCGVKCLNSSAVFQINFSAGLTVLCPEIPHERQAQKRYRQF